MQTLDDYPTRYDYNPNEPTFVWAHRDEFQPRRPVLFPRRHVRIDARTPEEAIAAVKGREAVDGSNNFGLWHLTGPRTWEEILVPSSPNK